MAIKSNVILGNYNPAIVGAETSEALTGTAQLFEIDGRPSSIILMVKNNTSEKITDGVVTIGTGDFTKTDCSETIKVTLEGGAVAFFTIETANHKFTSGEKNGCVEISGNTGFDVAVIVASNG